MPSEVEKEKLAGRFRHLIFPIVGLSYFLSAELGHALSFPLDFATFWPPAGIALAAYLFIPTRYWLRVLAATLAANLASDVLVHDRPVGVSLGFWFANSCESLFATWLMKRFCGNAGFFWTAKSVFQFVALPCLMGTALGATIGAAVVAATYGSGVITVWRVWWSADFVGMLIVFPIAWLSMEALTTRGFASIRSKFHGRYSLIEFLALLGLIAVGSWYVFGMQNERLAYAVYPILLAVSTRFRILGATSALTILAVITVGNTAAGNGLFGEIPMPADRAQVLQIYLFVTASTFLTLAAASRERWAAQQLQEVAQRKLVTATRGGEVGLWDWDILTNAVSWSDECHRQLGEVPGSLNCFADFEERLHCDDVERSQQRVAKALQPGSGDYTSTFRLRHSSGKYRWILSRGRVKFDEEQNPTRMSGTHVDITELKEVRDQLESYLNLLGATDGGWNWNLATGEVAYSPRFRELLGFSADSHDELPATLTAIKNRIHPDDWKSLKKSIISHLKFETPLEFDLQILVKSGEYRWFRARGLASREGTEKPTRMAGSIYDITDRKNAELSLRDRNADLAQFAYVASHDLQEPLRAVTGFCQLLELRYSDQLDEKGQSYIQHAVGGAKRMKRLMDDLLEFSRVSHNDIELNSVDLNSVVDRAIHTLSYLIKENNAEVHCDSLPTLLGNETMLTQMFQNFIANAIKFQNPGSTAEIKIWSRKTADNWEILIKDNGIGIEPNHCERIFEMFERLHDRSEFEGTGIGLAICQKIVARHYGSIRVESQPGQGSTFVVSIPQGTNVSWKRTPPLQMSALSSSRTHSEAAGTH